MTELGGQTSHHQQQQQQQQQLLLLKKRLQQAVESSYSSSSSSHQPAHIAHEQEHDPQQHQITQGMHQHLHRLHDRKAQLRHKSFKTIPSLRHLHPRRHRPVPPPPSSTDGEDTHTHTHTHTHHQEHQGELLRRKFKALFRHRLLRKREDSLLDTDALSEMGRLLQSVHSPPAEEKEEEEEMEGEGKESNDENVEGGEATAAGTLTQTPEIGRCNYDDFLRLRAEVPLAGARYFTVQNFLRCARDVHGRINTADFFRQLYNTLCMEKTRINLHYYDQEGKGFLKEGELENYIYELIPTLPALQGMPETFYSFYVFSAVRRFMVFLDTKRTGKIAIEKIVTSKVMEELMELAMFGPPPPSPPPPPPPSSHSPSPEEEEAAAIAAAAAAAEVFTRQQRTKNWFSAENALRVYNMYLDLDLNHNGLLSKRELLQYTGPFHSMRLTSAFIDRIYEESVTYRMGGGGGLDTHTHTHTYGGGGEGEEGDYGDEGGGGQGRRVDTVEAEMDYKVFLDFILAMEHRPSQPALRWFFRMLDITKTGYLSPFTLRYFFRDVISCLHASGYDAPRLDDVKDEIFDMARPKDPQRGISLEDFLKCGVGATIVVMLIDVHGFLNWDAREHAAAQAQAAAAAALEEEMQAQQARVEMEEEVEEEEEGEREEGGEEEEEEEDDEI